MKVEIYADELYPYYNVFAGDHLSSEKTIDWPTDLSWDAYKEAVSKFFEWQDRLETLCNAS